MNILGCTNPNAVNYDPLADQDDGSCTYLSSVQGVCYAFNDYQADSLRDQSFTISYSVEGNAWVFYHDYLPDFYIATRQQLFTLKNNLVWVHNNGPHGKFYKTTKDSFFIDVVFNFDSEVILNSVQWLTKVLDTAGKILPFKSFTHITVWNDIQCTGKQPLTNYVPLEPDGVNKHLSEFSCNELRDIVSVDGFFLESIFENMIPGDGTLDPNMPWYEKRYMQNKYFVVRLELDNTLDTTLSLHQVDATTDPTIS
jgi:hypothetical protein